MSGAAVQLGQKVRILREKIGKTQEELAEEAEISLKHLGEIERGRGNPTLNTLVSLSKALSVSLPELTDFGDESHPLDGISMEIRALVDQADQQNRVQILRVLKAMVGSE